MDFVHVMKDWFRMCQHMGKEYGNSSCDKCPLGGCSAVYQMCGKENFLNMERDIVAWASEHPEPVYETWLEFIKRFETGGRKSDDDFIYWMGTTSIPADLAQKLGLQPKEGT